MKKFNIILFIVLNIIVIVLLVYCFQKPEIKEITYGEGINKDNKKKLIISLKINNKFKTMCSFNGKWVTAKNDKCSYYVENGEYKIKIKNLNNTVEKNYKVSINEIIDIKLNIDKYYLAVGETIKLKEDIKYIGKPNMNLNWKSTNEGIATVENGVVKGISSGETDIIVETSNKKQAKCRIIVTDLITPMTLNNYKQIIPCNYYTEEQAKLLDEILAHKIKLKGEGTRASLIETIRFLPLSFKYKIPYFFENGRLEPYGKMHYVDGEGRYYNKGLYLSNSKKNNIKSSLAGPAIWGCPLTNYDTSYGWVYKGKYPNGLDCSGFITWALYNSGLDIGDIGSGVTSGQKDVSDLGEMHELTYEYANNGDYKVGDIIARDGHTAMIAGKDDEYIYIAESLLKGVVIEKFSYKDRNSKLYKLYGYINTLDKVYKSDGEYSNMW